jgi:ribose transport system substrate-binding protein
MRRRTFLSLALSSPFLLTGCRGKPPAKYRVAVIPKGMTHEHWQSVKRGAERAARDLADKGGVDVVWDGPRTEGDALEQINLIEQKAETGIRGLVLAPQDRTKMVDAVERVLDKGIPVVIIDSDIDLRHDLLLKYVATDNFNGGLIAGRRLLAAVKGKERPRLALLRYQKGSESTERREDGFLKALEEARGKQDFDLVSDNKYAGPTVITAQEQASGLLDAYPEGPKGLDGIFAVNESATAGLLNALREKERVKKIKLVGFDSSAPLLAALRDGEVEGLVVQDPYRMGYLGVWYVVQHQEGKDVKAGGREHGTGEYFLTRDDFETPRMKRLYDADAQEQRTTEELLEKPKT